MSIHNLFAIGNIRSVQKMFLITDVGHGSKLSEVRSRQDNVPTRCRTSGLSMHSLRLDNVIERSWGYVARYEAEGCPL